MPLILKKKISRLPGARRAVLSVLRRTNRDITVSNPFCDNRIRINTYTHKNYWFYRRDRERSTMMLFDGLIKADDTVVEVGAHIGLMSQVFSQRVGPSGCVVVFEPGSNNLPYLKKNIAGLANVTLVESALSDFDGEATFFEDQITGQNNSLLADYSGLDGVAATHGVAATRVERTVQVQTLDAYVDQHELTIDFVKMDIEGNELAALTGARSTLANARVLMVEVTENRSEVEQILTDAGFNLFDLKGNRTDHIGAPGNYFASRQDVSTLRS